MTFSPFDYECMATALQLARKGLNSTHPNPRVGCVISQDGRVVGRGWHVRTGAGHAEINALADAGAEAVGGTAYVTLEPCNHSGRTPPCTRALIRSGVARVVCALEDPNPEVSGSGFEYLRENGIEVQVGLLSEQAESINIGFLKRMRTGRPWVRIKLAQSADGHIALANRDSEWISSADSRQDVQRWRARSDAILTGIGTVLADDPSLNVRGSANARQPLRVIADSHWRLPVKARLLNLAGDVLIAGCNDNPIPKGLAATVAEFVASPASGGHIDLKALLQELGRRRINEVQVEAGARLCGALLQENLVDELLIYQAPLLLGGGALSPFAAPKLDKMRDRIHLEYLDVRPVGVDIRMRFKLKETP